MALETTSSTTSTLYANMVQTAQYVMNERAVIRPLVRNVNMVGTPGLTAQIPVFPTIASTGVADGTALSNTEYTTLSKEISCSEAGVMVTLTDLAREAATEDLAAALGKQMGNSLAEKIDTDLANLFSTFADQIGGSGTELTADLIFQAASILRSNKAAGPYYGVFHPKQIFNLKKQLTNAGANVINHNISDLGNAALREGVIANLAGVTIIESTVVAENDSAGNQVGGIFNEDALAYVLKRDIRVENLRVPSVRGEEWVASVAYGVGGVMDGNSSRPGYGVGITVDANY
jgi:hypothetical protein